MYLWVGSSKSREVGKSFSPCFPSIPHFTPGPPSGRSCLEALLVSLAAYLSIHLSSLWCTLGTAEYKVIGVLSAVHICLTMPRKPVSLCRVALANSAFTPPVTGLNGDNRPVSNLFDGTGTFRNRSGSGKRARTESEVERDALYDLCLLYTSPSPRD